MCHFVGKGLTSHSRVAALQQVNAREGNESQAHSGKVSGDLGARVPSFRIPEAPAAFTVLCFQECAWPTHHQGPTVLRQRVFLLVLMKLNAKILLRCQEIAVL